MHAKKLDMFFLIDGQGFFLQLFEDLMRECKNAVPGARLSFSTRRKLERQKMSIREAIVNRTKNDCTPLFVACKRGHVEIVKYLIETCNADIDKRGTFEVPDDGSVHHVTPLWCAAVSGKLSVLKCLLAHGADINATSDSGSTPVRSACFMTDLDVVQYLIENGADILKDNHSGGTCLINSVQSVELCTFLLKHGADVDASDIQNKTALHYAIQEHRFETTKLLLEHNADPYLKSNFNDDALETACIKGSIQIFDYLVENVKYSPEKLADANELMGSTCFEEHNDAQAALKYWRKAIEIRIANPINNQPLPKLPKIPQRESFKNAVEFATLDELNTTALDFDAMRIQSLLICERILGKHHIDTLYRLMYRGASYVDSWRYQDCIDIWRLVLELRIENDSILCTETCLTAQALVRIMIHLNDSLSTNQRNDQLRYCDVVSVFSLLTSQLDEARLLLEKRPVFRRQQDCYDRILKCVTYLIYLLLKIGETSEQKAQTRQLVHELVKQNPKSACAGDTLLHLCVSSFNILVSNFVPSNEPQTVFPHVGVVKLLLECGAHVNARNECRLMPLHVASNPYNFHNSLIELLLDFGAHLDTPHFLGDTPADFISSNPQNSINVVNYMSLRCYAAQAIIEYGLPYRDIPVTLHQFLELHRP